MKHWAQNRNATLATDRESGSSLTNATDPVATAITALGTDEYEARDHPPGLLANALRFENPNAGGTPTTHG